MIETLISHSSSSSIYHCTKCSNDFLVQLTSQEEARGEKMPTAEDYVCRTCKFVSSVRRPVPIIGTDEVVGGKGK